MEIIQNIFYTLASVFMLLGIFFMGFLIFVVWKVYQAAVKAQRDISEMKDNVTEKVNAFVSSGPTKVASVLGTGFASMIFRKIRDAFRKTESTEPEV